MDEDREFYLGYIKGKQRSLKKAIGGKSLGGVDYTEDSVILEAISKKLGEFELGGQGVDGTGNI